MPGNSNDCGAQLCPGRGNHAADENALAATGASPAANAVATKAVENVAPVENVARCRQMAFSVLADIDQRGDSCCPSGDGGPCQNFGYRPIETQLIGNTSLPATRRRQRSRIRPDATASPMAARPKTMDSTARRRAEAASVMVVWRSN